MHIEQRDRVHIYAHKANIRYVHQVKQAEFNSHPTRYLVLCYAKTREAGLFHAQSLKEREISETALRIHNEGLKH